MKIPKLFKKAAAFVMAAVTALWKGSRTGLEMWKALTLLLL